MRILPVLTVLVVIAFNALTVSSKEDQYQYYDDGQVRETKKFYPSGELRELDTYRDNGTIQSKETFDKSGNRLTVSNYSSKGRLVENVDGWAAIRWTYDGGNISTETYYGADRRLKERKTFNRSGDLVGKEYFGGEIDPGEEFTPWPTVAGETVSYYDEYGRPEGRTRAVVW